MASQVRSDCANGHANTMLAAGDPDNTTYLTRPEARQALFTQLVAGLEFLGDQRLGRPLGTLDKPHPERAESRASRRSVTNIRVSVRAMKAMVQTLTSDAPQTMAGFDLAIGLADALQDPAQAGVATPDGRLRALGVQQAVTALRNATLADLAPEPDMGTGLNATDGD